MSRINGKLRNKCRRADFVSAWDPWTRWFPKEALKQKLWTIQATTFFGVKNFHSSEAIRWFFFSKCTKFYVHFKNAKKIWQNVFFWDNGIWTCCGNLPQLWRKYMWLTVNVLSNNPKILDLNKKDVFWLNLSQSNGKVG